MAEIRLKHQYPNTVPVQTMYFYDGRARVEYGVVTLPTHKPAWLQRAFVLGYRIDPDTGKFLSLAEIMRVSTKSAGDIDEGSDGGGLPAGEDGLRDSELTSVESVSEPELGSGVSDGTTDDGDGDGPSA